MNMIYIVHILLMMIYSGVGHPNRGDLRNLQRLERIFFRWVDHRESYHRLLQKKTSVTSFKDKDTTFAGFTTVQQIDFRTLRFSYLELRVSDSA